MQYCNPSLANLWSVIPCPSINIWYLLQLIQMLQSRQHDLFTCFLNLACKEHLVENRIHLIPQISSDPPPSLSPTPMRTHLIEIKHQIQLTHIPKEAIQHLDKEVYSLQIRQLIIIRIHADAEEQPRIPSIDDLVVAELFRRR